MSQSPLHPKPHEPSDASPRPGWRAALRHAFAVDPPGPAEPTPAQREVVERLCNWVAARGLSTPATLLLDMCRPLNAVTAAGMQAFHPAVWALGSEVSTAQYEQLAEYLERRGALEWMADRIEELRKERASESGSSGGS